MGSGGVVVAVIDTGEYTADHPESQWGYLKKGAMIEFPLHGLIHDENAEPDLQLIERSPPSEHIAHGSGVSTPTSDTTPLFQTASALSSV
jgi:hypothetical protein